MQSKDIHIGEKERIHWQDVDYSTGSTYDIDYAINQHPDFWSALQIFCTPDCCGLDAFRFYPDDIADASKQVDKAILKQVLTKLRRDIVDSGKEVITSSILNNLVDKTIFIKLLDHINQNL